MKPVRMMVGFGGMLLLAGLAFAEPAPTLAPAPGAYPKAVPIVIDRKASASEIRFTLDGKDPTAQSLVYDQPFLLGASATVKAAFFAKNKMTSTVVSATYDLPTPQADNLPASISSKETVLRDLTAKAKQNFWAFGGRVLGVGQPLPAKGVEITTQALGQPKGGNVMGNTVFGADGWFLASWTWDRGSRGPTEELQLEAKAFGFRSQTVLVPMQKALPTMANLELTALTDAEKTSVRGVLLDERGKPFPGAELVLRFTHGPKHQVSGQPGEAKLVAITGKDGRFEFPGLAEDDYWLSCENRSSLVIGSVVHSTKNSSAVTELRALDTWVLNVETDFQPDGSPDFAKGGLIHNEFQVAGSPVVVTFEPGRGSLSFSDLMIVPTPGRPDLRGVFGPGTESQVADAGEAEMASVKNAPTKASVYTNYLPWTAGHVYVVKTLPIGGASKYARVRVNSIEKRPPATTEELARPLSGTIEYVLQKNGSPTWLGGDLVTRTFNWTTGGTMDLLAGSTKSARGESTVSVRRTEQGATLFRLLNVDDRLSYDVDLGSVELATVTELGKGPWIRPSRSGLLLAAGHAYVMNLMTPTGLDWVKFRVTKLQQ